MIHSLTFFGFLLSTEIWSGPQPSTSQPGGRDGGHREQKDMADWQIKWSDDSMTCNPMIPNTLTLWYRYSDSARMKPRWRRIRRFRTMPFASLYYWTLILDDLEVADFQGCLNQVKVSVKLLEMLLVFFSFLLCVWSSGRCLVWLRWIPVDSWYPGWRGGCKDCRVPLRSLMHSTHNPSVKKITYLTCRKVGSSPQICYHRQAKRQ